MEGRKVLYFYLKKGANYKNHRWSKGKMPITEVDMGSEGKLVCCSVPEFYMKNKAWENEKLADGLSGLLKEHKAEDYYLHPEMARLTGIEEKLPPEIFLEKILSQVPCLEYLIYIGWGNGYREGRFGEEAFREERQMLFRLLEPYLARINHFTLVTDRPEAYEEFTEYIYEEYGIPTASVSEVERRFGKDGKTVILDVRKDYETPFRLIPQRAAYVDFWSVGKKRKQMERTRRDIRYISAVKFLDTLLKNGYNTIVN